jgi:hypothetical protein
MINMVLAGDRVAVHLHLKVHFTRNAAVKEPLFSNAKTFFFQLKAPSNVFIFRKP